MTKERNHFLHVHVVIFRKKVHYTYNRKQNILKKTQINKTKQNNRRNEQKQKKAEE